MGSLDEESTGCKAFGVDTDSLACFLYGAGGDGSNSITAATPGTSVGLFLYMKLEEWETLKKNGSCRLKTYRWFERGGNKRSHDIRDPFKGETFMAEGSNIAFNKTASMSSVLDDRYGPQNAVDGINASDMMKGSCTHTHVDKFLAWWQVDLGRVYNIQHIKIWNRNDCCYERLRDFNIFLGNKTETEPGFIYRPCLFHSGTFQGSKTFTCTSFTSGQVVKIQLTKLEHLSLCEVEVYGFP